MAEQKGNEHLTSLCAPSLLRMVASLFTTPVQVLEVDRGLSRVALTALALSALALAALLLTALDLAAILLTALALTTSASSAEICQPRLTLWRAST